MLSDFAYKKSAEFVVLSNFVQMIKQEECALVTHT